MASIHFFTEDIQFKVSHPIKTRRWINQVIQQEKKVLGELNFIFCSDEYLLSINKEYLQHNYYTDIITFDSSESENEISGDIFISIERAIENSKSLHLLVEEEINRLIIHGVLHLIGYSDKSVQNKVKMRKKEDAYLSLRST